MEDKVEQLLNGQCYKKYQELGFAEVMEKYHLTLLEVRVLLFFDAHGSSNTARDLVEIYHFTKSNVSKSVDNLLGRGFLKKQYDSQDRRYIHLMIQPEAQPVLELAKKCQHEMYTEMFRGISRRDIQIVSDIAQKIHQNISDAIE